VVARRFLEPQIIKNHSSEINLVWIDIQIKSVSVLFLLNTSVEQKLNIPYVLSRVYLPNLPLHTYV